MPLPPSPVVEQWELFPPEISSYRDGRDELNLAEFPIATVGNRFDPSIKTLRFEDHAFDRDSGETIHRKLTITASDLLGLPTAADDEVLLGLLQLSRWQRFSSQTVMFTPYQLLKVLGWRVSTANYRRLRESIQRWLGVTLHYENAWRDKQTGRWADAGFHFIEFVEFYKPGENNNVLAPEGLSIIRWNELVFRNLREGNLKTLDFHLYRQLQSGVSKRMFRFLDKRFYHRRRVTFELEKFACEKIGLTRPVKISTTGRATVDVAQIKRRLLPAIRELELMNFIVPVPAALRFTKEPSGEWQVAFERAGAAAEDSGQAAQPALALDVAEISPLEGRLAGHGVSLSQARRLVSEHDPERVEGQLEALEYLLTKGEKFAPQNRAGWLVQAVTENYGPPRGFKTRAQREAAAHEKSLKVQARLQKQRQHAQDKAQEVVRLEGKLQQADAYLAGLNQAQRTALEEAALQASEVKGRVSATMHRMIVRGYVMELLSKQPANSNDGPRVEMNNPAPPNASQSPVGVQKAVPRSPARPPAKLAKRGGKAKKDRPTTGG